MERVEQSVRSAHSRLEDLENRSMRDNLLFTGVPETVNERPENTETIVHDIVQNKMGLPAVHFERVHRMGPPNRDATRPRTIVAKFSSHKARELVRKNSKNLKGTKIGVHEQYSRDTNEKRKKLMTKFREARGKNKYSVLQQDFLIVEDAKFRVDTDGSIFKDPHYNRPPPERTNTRVSAPTGNAHPASGDTSAHHAQHPSTGAYNLGTHVNTNNFGQHSVPDTVNGPPPPPPNNHSQSEYPLLAGRPGHL